MEKVCVAVRVRPSVSEEPASGIYWKIEKNRIRLQKNLGSPVHALLTYAFDYVFDQDCGNGTVYERLAKEIIHAAVDGFNGTAFAYGQTSSGKTFTMNGSEADPGIIHLAVKDVFQKIHQMVDREFLVRVSYMEIYNEEINDLFVIESQKLQIHESLERGVFVKGLKEEIVNNAEQVLKLLELGEANKHFGETNMNIQSSRSHTIFRMVIESKVNDHSCNGNSFTSDAIRVSVLNLVDLAGSERIAKTGAGGIRLKEGKHINKSLMILGNVINKLGDGAKQKGHIPYRDSKLTRILQPALGGNAKTSIICTMAPEEIHIEESKGTLQFASRAKRITNCIQVNEILTDAALLKRQKLEIEVLRQKLQGSRAEVLEQEILKLRNEMLKYEQEREKLELELEEERKSHKYQRDECNREQQLKDNLTNLATLGSDQSLNQDQCSGDVFGTLCFKPSSKSFVVKRSNYSRPPDCSPIPDTLSSIADEYAWSKMNNGFMTDLDLLEMTPAREVQSFPCSDVTSGFTNKAFEDDTYDPKMELELIIQQKNDLETSLRNQITENNHLKEEISGLQQERIPSPLLEPLGKCKDVYEDVLSNMMASIAGKGSSSNKAKLLSGIGEVGSSLFSALEAHFSVAMKGLDGSTASSGSNLLEEELHMLRMRLNTTISSLLSPEPAASVISAMLPQEESLGKRRVAEADFMDDKYDKLEREFEAKNLLLEDLKGRCLEIERESQTLLDERNCLLQTVAESSRKFEKVLTELNGEVQRRKEHEKEMKRFSEGFASRHKLVLSFQNELGSYLEKMKADIPASLQSKGLQG